MRRFQNSLQLQSSKFDFVFPACRIFLTRVWVVSRQGLQLIWDACWKHLISFLFGNGLGLTGIEAGGVRPPTAKPSLTDYVSRHRQANWPSGPPKNDAGRNSMSMTVWSSLSPEKEVIPRLLRRGWTWFFSDASHALQLSLQRFHRLQLPPRKTPSAYFLLRRTKWLSVSIHN